MSLRTRKDVFAFNALADTAVEELYSDPNGYACVSLVGVVTTEEVAFQIPAVPDPDKDNPAHWTPLMQNDAAFVLRAGHNADSIPAALRVRIVKPAGVNGNPYTVRLT